MSEMPERAGYLYRIENEAGARRPPLVLLHGMGGDENALIAFGQSIAPQRKLFSLRGTMPWKDGYTFFLRRPDDSLDLEDLAANLPGFIALIRDLGAREGVPPVLVGYSNGSIITTALIGVEPGLVSGAVLIRPMPPGPDFRPVALNGLPILMLGGRNDERRKPEDFPKLERLLRDADGHIAAQLLNCGHGWEASGLDSRLAAAWLAGFDPEEEDQDEL